MRPSSRPFSLILPEGGRVACRVATVYGVGHDARGTNYSRAVRELPHVLLLNRDTGTVFEVDPEEDLDALERTLTRDIRNGPTCPVAHSAADSFAYHVVRSVPHDSIEGFGYTLLLRYREETMVVVCPPGSDATVWTGGPRRPWETFASNQTDDLSRAWAR